jgi:hypothetical protein
VCILISFLRLLLQDHSFLTHPRPQVHYLQGPHHTVRLRDPRWDELGDVLDAPTQRPPPYVENVSERTKTDRPTEAMYMYNSTQAK